MKSVVAFLLLVSIPCQILAFSVRPQVAVSHRACSQSSFVLNAVDQKEAAATPAQATEAVVEEEEEESETQKLLKKVKEAGTAGAISYAVWELGFWGISVPVCCVGFRQLTGHWPDFSNSEDMQKVGAEAFAFVNFARFAVPLRIGLALSTTPWIDKNVVQKFKKEENAAN